MSKSAIERFNEGVMPEPNSGCWLWVQCVTQDGYGRLWVNGKTVRTHRFAYEHLVGPIATGMQIDHLCRNPACCNPQHLEVVTAATNLRRAAATITHCPQGHEYTEENTYLYKGRIRHCKKCMKQHGVKWRRKKGINPRAKPQTDEPPNT